MLANLLNYQCEIDRWKIVVSLFLEDGSILKEMIQAFASCGNTSLWLEGRS